MDTKRRKVDFSVGRYEYTYAYIDPDSIRSEPTIPDLDLTADVELSGGLLREGVELVAFTNDYIQAEFLTDQQTLRFSAEGSTDDAAWTAHNEDLIVRSGGRADSRFSRDYSRDIVAAIPEDEQVRLRIGEEFPMKVSYKIVADDDALGHSYHGEVTFLQAPRIAQ